MRAILLVDYQTNIEVMPRHGLALKPSMPGHYERAVWYGDGFFETILIPVNADQGSYPKNWLFPHFDRITNTRIILRMSYPDFLVQYEDFERYVWRIFKQTVKSKKLNTPGNQQMLRIRFLFYRMPGGLYAFETSDCQTEIDLSLSSRNARVLTIQGRSQEIFLPPNAISQVKSISALPYVMASRERAVMGYQDMFLLNTDKLIVECTASNIFWCIDGVWYTTHHRSGAISGTMQRRVRDQLNRMHGTLQPHRDYALLLNDNYKEDRAKKKLQADQEPAVDLAEPFVHAVDGLRPEDLTRVQHMLTTNANGIAQVEGVVWDKKHYLFKPLPASFLMEMYRICSPQQLDEPLKWVAPEH